MDQIILNVESNPDIRFYAAYAGLRMLWESKMKMDKAGEISILGAEAYCLLQELREVDPELFKESQEEYDLSKPKIPLRRLTDMNSNEFGSFFGQGFLTGPIIKTFNSLNGFHTAIADYGNFETYKKIGESGFDVMFQLDRN